MKSFKNDESFIYRPPQVHTFTTSAMKKISSLEKLTSFYAISNIFVTAPIFKICLIFISAKDG